MIIYADKIPSPELLNDPNYKGEPVQPVPVDQWPAWAAAVGRRRRPGELGVGDTVHRRTGRMGKWFEAWTKKLGVPCGCAQRREDWNAAYPYPSGAVSGS